MIKDLIQNIIPTAIPKESATTRCLRITHMIMIVAGTKSIIKLTGFTSVLFISNETEFTSIVFVKTRNRMSAEIAAGIE